jgi:hypothetical protein
LNTLNRAVNISVISWRSVLLVEENAVSGKKPTTCSRSLTNFITLCCFEYFSPWTGFELTTLVLIDSDCTGSCKFNYHTITATKAPKQNQNDNSANTMVKLGSKNGNNKYFEFPSLININSCTFISRFVYRSVSLNKYRWCLRWHSYVDCRLIKHQPSWCLYPYFVIRRRIDILWDLK